eukprot:s819_g17.t1
MGESSQELQSDVRIFPSRIRFCFGKDQWTLAANNCSVFALSHLVVSVDQQSHRIFPADFLPAHWRLETAWAEAAEPEDQDALKMIQDAKTAIESLLQDREGYARTMQKPFADGKWIQEQTGLDIEEIGPLKEWLFYLQVDENLQSLEEVKAKLKSGWPDLKQVPVVSWPPEKPGS